MQAVHRLSHVFDREPELGGDRVERKRAAGFDEASIDVVADAEVELVDQRGRSSLVMYAVNSGRYRCMIACASSSRTPPR